VLLLDSDVTLFDDPYKYLKQPPFKDLVVINQEENREVSNGGVLYVQVPRLSASHCAEHKGCLMLRQAAQFDVFHHQRVIRTTYEETLRTDRICKT